MMRKIFGILAVVGLVSAFAGSATAATFKATESEMVFKISGLPAIKIPALPIANDRVRLVGRRGVQHIATPISAGGLPTVAAEGTVWSTIGFSPGTSLFTGVPLISNLILTVKIAETGLMTYDLPTAQFTPPGLRNPVGPAGTNDPDIATGPHGFLPAEGRGRIGALGGLISLNISVLGAGGTTNVTFNGPSILVTGGPWVTGKIVMTNITTNIISLPDRAITGEGIKVTGNAFTLDPPTTEIIKTMTTLGQFVTSNPNGVIKVQHQVTLAGRADVTSTFATGTLAVGHMTYVAPLRINMSGFGEGLGNLPGQMKLEYHFTPEPSVMVLGAAGALGLIALGRRRGKK